MTPERELPLARAATPVRHRHNGTASAGRITGYQIRDHQASDGPHRLPLFDDVGRARLRTRAPARQPADPTGSRWVTLTAGAFLGTRACAGPPTLREPVKSVRGHTID